MKRKSDVESFQDFAYAVADYISAEYMGEEIDGGLNDDERWTIKNVIMAHFESDDSTCNAAAYIMNYIRSSKKWRDSNNA